MNGAGKFKIFDTSALRGKVPSIFIENYLEDPQNIEMVNFVAGLHLSCGDFDLGVDISENIVEKTLPGGDNLKEVCIGVWNLYVLSKIYIEQEKFDKAYRALDNAERYWTKDMALVDGSDMYRIRCREDLWLRRAFGYLVQNRKDAFESIIDRVMMSRYDYYNRAYKVTGEVPIRDRCLLDCFEYSSYMCRYNEDLTHSLTFIKTALRYLGRIPIDNDYLEGRMCEKKQDFRSAYDCYLKFYLTNRPQLSCDSQLFETCGSCAYFETMDGIDGECKRHNLKVERHRSCSNFLSIPVDD